jgi:hypothetical protein
VNRTAALAVLLFVALNAHASCDLHVRAVPAGAPSAIEWDHFVGAAAYQVTESRDEFLTSRTYIAHGEHFTIPHRVSDPTPFAYRVQSLADPSVQTDSGCFGAVTLTLPPDPAFRRMVRKAIVPVAGSVVGATGAKFRTALRLTSNGAGERGRIVFHPAGQASDGDPSIPYAFTGTRLTLAWDDIVAAIGTTGIGTIDIVPADDSDSPPPLILARHYTDAPSGTFGSFEPPVYPFDYLTAPALHLTIPESRFRVSLGVRTLTATNMQALIYGLDGRVRALKNISFPADYFALIPATQFLGDVVPGETVTIAFDGSVVPFYTITENATNDPAVVLPGMRDARESTHYVE